MKVYSYFLPQFHHIPKNDKYWGKGFTDWVSVNNAKSTSLGQKSPVIPDKLGYYDLSKLSDLRNVCSFSQQQGIDGFAYWHYWFGNGEQALEKIQEMHIQDSSIKQMFFFAWANSDWTKSWVGDDSTTIFKQIYTVKSALDHFDYLIPFISDPRYIKNDGRPIFQVNNPDQEGCIEHILVLERQAIEKFGVGFFWLFPNDKNVVGIDGLHHAKIGFPPGDVTVNSLIFRIKRYLQRKKLIEGPVLMSQATYLKMFKKNLKKLKKNSSCYPCILAGWNNTPRYNENGFFISGNILKLIHEQLKILEKEYYTDKEKDFVLVKAWNEWAEGNVLEPYIKDGKSYNPSKAVMDFKKRSQNYSTPNDGS